jgi:DNA-binding NarL/FixJ family response regulator
MSMKDVVRVLLCDDQVSVRSHLRKMLGALPAIQIIGEADGGRAGVCMALELLPDVVVMDISMPDLNGILATRQILAAAPAVKVVMFSAECDPQVAQQALSAGASSYLIKNANAEEFLRALQLIQAGGRYVSPALGDAASAVEQRTTDPSRGTPGPGRTSPLRVVLVDDAPHIRERLAEMLAAVDGIQVVGQAADVPLATRLIQDFRPDVLVLELELPGQTGMDLLVSVGKQPAKPLIIILTTFDYPVLRRACAELGADFFFYKPSELQKVVEVCADLAKRMVKSRQPILE